MYSVDNESSSGDNLFLMSVDAGGINTTTSIPNAFFGAYVGIHYDRTTNRIYSEEDRSSTALPAPMSEASGPLAVS